MPFIDPTIVPYFILSLLSLAALVAAATFFLVVRPVRVLRKWALGLSNGGHFPEVADLEGCFWLKPVHRELLGVSQKLKGREEEIASLQTAAERSAFIHHCILASLIEGILVVNEEGVVTLVNSELMNMFQLTESPLNRTVSESLKDPRLVEMVREAIHTGRVQAARITRQTGTEGRPPAYEVSAVPIRSSIDGISGAIILFLPPPDRTRILQTMKRHSQRLDNLVHELLLSANDSQLELDLKRRKVDIRYLFEEVLTVFSDRVDRQEIKTSCRVRDDFEIFADPAYLHLALVHLLLHCAGLCPQLREIELQAESGIESDGIYIRMAQCSHEDAQAIQVLYVTSPAHTHFSSADRDTRVIGVGPDAGMVREILQRHSARLKFDTQGDGQLLVSLLFPLEPNDTYPNDAASTGSTQLSASYGT